MPRRDDSHVNIVIDRYDDEDLTTGHHEPSLELPLQFYIDDEDDVTLQLQRRQLR